mgnify:CR=1 FL=1
MSKNKKKKKNKKINTIEVMQYYFAPEESGYYLFSYNSCSLDMSLFGCAGRYINYEGNDGDAYPLIGGERYYFKGCFNNLIF